MRYPSLRQGLIGAWCPSLGATGYRLLDRSGYGNHGTLTNMDAGTDWVGGPRGPVLEFNGVNQNITNFSRIISPVGQPRTVSAWINVQSTTRRGIVGTRVTWNGWIFNVNSGNIAGRVDYFHTGRGIVTALNAFSINAWAHVSATWNGSTASIYTAGLLRATNNIPADLADTTNGYIGSEEIEPILFFLGFLDDVRIYNRELTSAEIRLLASEPGIGLKPERTSVYFGDSLSSRRRKILTGLT